ncbi:hypothetical protein V500_10614 [Pseudogymnoascus sp. VKM F-4518 (FW-2643)]|nr:hypothetical protein V500_10614 [Pseudogymnoascus sp. VKM F-4518 (FW-2643)]
MYLIICTLLLHPSSTHTKGIYTNPSPQATNPTHPSSVHFSHIKLALNHLSRLNSIRNAVNNISYTIDNSADNVEQGRDTPAALAVERAQALPVIVVVREDDGLATNSLTDGLDSDGLRDGARARGAIALTSGWPSSLEVDTGLARAELVDDVELALDELSGVGRDGGRVEEGVDVGADDVDGGAEHVLVLLEHVEGLGGGHGAGVAGASEDRLGGGDEGGELLGGADTVEDGLVTDDNEDDEVPAGEGREGGDLRLGALNAGLLDVDTDDQVEAVGFAASGDVLEAVAVGLVSRVETDGGEALGGDVLEVHEDGGGILALAGLVVGGVGDGPLVTGRAETALGWGWRGCCLGGLDGGGGGGGWDGELRRRRGVRAVHDVVGLSDGGGDGGLGVGAGNHGGGGWVDEDGRLGHGGGRGGDGVRAGAGADVGGLDDDRGGHAVGGADGGDGADDRGLGGDDGGDTSVGVGALGNRGRGGSADGGLLSHGDGRGRDGVGSWLEGGGGWGWERHNWDGHNGDGRLGGGWDGHDAAGVADDAAADDDAAGLDLLGGGGAARLNSTCGADGDAGWDEAALVEGIVCVVVRSAGADSKGCGHSEEASLHVEELRNE